MRTFPAICFLGFLLLACGGRPEVGTTPQATFAAYQGALKAHDYAALADLLDPAILLAIDTRVASAKKAGPPALENLAEKMGVSTRTLESLPARDLLARFLEHLYGRDTGPSDPLESATLGNVEIHGDTATLQVVIDGLEAAIEMVRHDGVWYFDAPASSLMQSDRSQAATQLDVLAAALRLYFLNRRCMPESLEELTAESPRTGEPYVDGIPTDPWGHPYAFHPMGGRKFELSSAGPDGRAGTEDDIVWK
jgi:hypothetical protein